MVRTRKIVIILLVTFLMAGAIVGGALVFSRSKAKARMSVDDEVYHEAEHTLKGFLGIADDSAASYQSSYPKDDSFCEENDTTRMTQRVTIVTENGVLPIMGTVSKLHDAYYPGTYEVSFNNSALLTESAEVIVKIPVKKDQKIYILTGNKDVGYKQYAVVDATSDSCVHFSVRSIQDYTISTTDIISAQDTMDSLVSGR
ncbi:hypothetical protein [Butyrivibrio sp. YAB3001]|uniref:hypothetical protein n=1 Tax=Butyrivibrio sp. YAB3001 TaxID=1520812 RepID=UPI0008F64F08|nr:hypothetical protein [Butyrivibrio sp. YAB3001]SFB76360.1 hypothetical protein SAMN02910398_00679 [Butyrivibrio sp. YAB3001]